MKKSILFITVVVIIAIFFSSCATIIGGANYYAKVQVPGYPNAQISVNGQYKGEGEALFEVKRKDADKLYITIQETNCEQETTIFTRKSFRGWSFVGSLLGWTTSIGAIPLPIGVLVDAFTGAWWGPDVREKGVVKLDYDNYLYSIGYNAIPTKEQVSIPVKIPSGITKIELLRELKELVDEGILTEEEYEREKTKILNQKSSYEQLCPEVPLQTYGS